MKWDHITSPNNSNIIEIKILILTLPAGAIIVLHQVISKLIHHFNYSCVCVVCACSIERVTKYREAYIYTQTNECLVPNEEKSRSHIWDITQLFAINLPSHFITLKICVNSSFEHKNFKYGPHEYKRHILKIFLINNRLLLIQIQLQFIGKKYSVRKKYCAK